MMYRLVALWLLLLCGLLSACDQVAEDTAVASTSRPLAPTLAASATPHILFSEEIAEQAVGLGQNDLTAAALPNDSVLPPLVIETGGTDTPEIVQVVMNDGTLFEGELYQRGIDRVPGLLLIANDEDMWGNLPNQLRDAGFTVLSVFYTRPVPDTDDIGTLLRSLFEVGTVDPAKLAIIGVDAYADTAFLGCAVNIICNMAVLINPTAEGTLINMLPTYVPRPLLVIANRNATETFSSAQSLVVEGGESAQIIVREAVLDTPFLQVFPELAQSIINWLGDTLNAVGE